MIVNRGKRPRDGPWCILDTSQQALFVEGLRGRNIAASSPPVPEKYWVETFKGLIAGSSMTKCLVFAGMTLGEQGVSSL